MWCVKIWRGICSQLRLGAEYISLKDEPSSVQGKGFLAVLCQTVTWSFVELLPIGPLWAGIGEIWKINETFLVTLYFVFSHVTHATGLHQLTLWPRINVAVISKHDFEYIVMNMEMFSCVYYWRYLTTHRKPPPPPPPPPKKKQKTKNWFYVNAIVSVLGMECC